MMDQDLTDHQRRCFEHISQARTLKMSLSAYARCHGLGVRMLYDAVVRLKEKGVIAGDVKAIGSAKPRSQAGDDKEEKSAFVAVRIEPSKTQNFVPVLRLNHVQGHVLEFGSWPPPEVMTTILTGGRDVAP